MNKVLLSVVLSALAGVAAAQGFTGPGAGAGVTTVAQAKQMADDSWVVLEGNIVNKVRHEHYTFQDGSGSIVVDIDDKYWGGQTVSPQDRVRIEGEVDREFTRPTEIEVKRIQKVAP